MVQAQKEPTRTRDFVTYAQTTGFELHRSTLLLSNNRAFADLNGNGQAIFIDSPRMLAADRVDIALNDAPELSARTMSSAT
jgi:hypothetical protein